MNIKKKERYFFFFFFCMQQTKDEGKKKFGTELLSKIVGFGRGGQSGTTTFNVD